MQKGRERKKGGGAGEVGGEGRGGEANWVKWGKRLEGFGKKGEKEGRKIKRGQGGAEHGKGR